MRLGLSMTSLVVIAGLTVNGTAHGQSGEKSNIPLPSAEQSTFLAAQAPGGLRQSTQAIPLNVKIKFAPKYSIYSEFTEGAQSVDLALQSANELVILLKPDLTGPEISAALEQNKLRIIQTMPEIGAVVVDASQRLGPSALPAAAAGVEAATDTPINLLARTLREDGRFVAVTPNSAISTFNLKSAFWAKPVAASPAAANEQSDWGMADTKLDAVWSKMTVPVRIGVIDVGFADHEDLDATKGLPGTLAKANHGNHVAGILCAKHNGIGVKGGLRNCTLVESSGWFVLNGPSAPEGFDADPFVTLFSEYVGTTLRFISANPGVRVINLSLGYNWMSNFNIDPRGPAYAAYRNDVKQQGAIFAAVLAHAKSQNVALVMAAGNDSTSLNPPLEAEWASPFNQGSKLVEQQDGWTNGLIVEAYDKTHQRASFSNVKGHVTCPGVDVLSSLASGSSAYGLMSGTSMAAPYCAAGLAAGIMLRPDLSLRQVIECVRKSPNSVGGVPRMDVDFVVNTCDKH
jgi:subtilisin family serine protease